MSEISQEKSQTNLSSSKPIKLRISRSNTEAGLEENLMSL